MTMLTPRSFLFSPTKQSNASPSTQSAKVYAEPQTTSRAGDDTATSQYDDREIPNVTMAKSNAASSDPVLIPSRPHRDDSQRNHGAKERWHSGGKMSGHRSRDQHPQEAVSAAVTALLANTAIPRQRSRTAAIRQSGQVQLLTVDAVFNHTKDSEKEFSLTLGGSPMDLLLSPPEDMADADPLDSETGSPSYLSKGTMSSNSVPSLVDGSIGDSSISPGFPITPPSRGKRTFPTRKLEPLSSPPGEKPLGHPLSDSEFDVEELDFRVFGSERNKGEKLDSLPAPRQRSAFKSNLTASLRALRSAAKSISNMTTPMITPDDFLTRSIIAIDPRVPFTDERMPPRLEDMPTPALRRYLNPTTNAPIEAHVPASLPQSTGAKCTASIQMQTYKVSKLHKAEVTGVINRRSSTSSGEEVFADVAASPVARQRDMRENSDFIRVAVMEMRMRKNGKLADNVPGRARWALPPRQSSTKIYEIGEGGVPVRWIAISAG